MTLQTVKQTHAAKLGPIAATYRAAHASMYGTCPQTCSLNPLPETSATTIDREYLQALLGAVPRRGVAWTYTHFRPVHWIQAWRTRRAKRHPTTTINWSTENKRAAARAAKSGIPTVLAAPVEDARKVEHKYGVTFVQCPATWSANSVKAVQCATCGGGEPLCARPDRDYVIVFPAHGAAHKRVGTDQKGGCYASGGNVALHWRKLAQTERQQSDADALRAFVRRLNPRTMLRHHIAGDIGKAPKARAPIACEVRS